MKKQFFRCAAGLIPFIALCSFAYGQTNKFPTESGNPASKEVAYNNTAINKDVPETVNINAKALKNFSKTYKKADAGWFAIKDGFLAEFKEDGVTTKVYYDPKGRWIGNIRTYFEDKLPKDIRHLVKSNYYDYNIFLVHEISVVGGITVYLVKMEDKTSFKTIRIKDGEMEESENFTKSK